MGDTDLILLQFIKSTATGLIKRAITAAVQNAMHTALGHLDEQLVEVRNRVSLPQYVGFGSLLTFLFRSRRPSSLMRQPELRLLKTSMRARRRVLMRRRPRPTRRLVLSRLSPTVTVSSTRSSPTTAASHGPSERSRLKTLLIPARNGGHRLSTLLTLPTLR